jgi:hypothetical protein
MLRRNVGSSERPFPAGPRARGGVHLRTKRAADLACAGSRRRWDRDAAVTVVEKSVDDLRCDRVCFSLVCVVGSSDDQFPLDHRTPERRGLPRFGHSLAR